MNMNEILSVWNVRSPEEFAARASEHLPFWVSLILVVLIAWYLAKLVWLVLPGATEVQWQPPPQVAVTAGTGGGSDYSSIINAHLFGRADQTPVPVVEDVVEAPETRLNLKLRATVVDQNDRMAHAIIADGSGNEKVYFLKDSIPGGASLHQVRLDRVILNRGGVLEALRLPRDESETPARPRGARSSARRGSAAPTVQEVISQNAATFTQIVRPQPYMPGGQLKGYRVYPGRNRQQFSALGLRPGDLVTAVNGTPLNDPTQGMEIFKSLGTATQVGLTIERNGQQQNLSIDTSQIATGDGAAR